MEFNTYEVTFRPTYKEFDVRLNVPYYRNNLHNYDATIDLFGDAHMIILAKSYDDALDLAKRDILKAYEKEFNSIKDAILNGNADRWWNSKGI